MSIAADVKQNVIREHRRNEKDSGSPEVQVAILTSRIAELTGHLRGHDKDCAARRGLVMMVGKRNRLLAYLARANHTAYQALIKTLGLRK